jgi:hypothetical protein
MVLCGGDSLLKLVTEGRTVGKKSKERQRIRIIDDLKVGSYTEMKTRAEKRA